MRTPPAQEPPAAFVLRHTCLCEGVSYRTSSGAPPHPSSPNKKPRPMDGYLLGITTVWFAEQLPKAEKNNIQNKE